MGKENMIKKVISGGQTGADRAGLDAAKALGIATGGFAPKGWRIENFDGSTGSDPTLKSFGLVETGTSEYPPRTRLNAQQSDGTVWFGYTESPGARLTLATARKAGKPTICNPSADTLKQWIEKNSIKTLNVAGNRLSSFNPEIYQQTYKVLIEALGQSMSGKYVLIEGGENCGKSTQIANLQAFFPTLPLSKQFTGLTVTREPGGTALGQEIRRMLLHSKHLNPMTELCLFAADRSEHMAKVVKPALEKGHLVVQDRGFLSTIAYQKHGRGIEAEIVQRLNRSVMHDIQPDLVIWLDVPVEVAMRRGEFCDRIEQESLDFHQRVHEFFYQHSANNYQRIDGTQYPSQVFEDVIEALAEHLE